MRLPPQAPGAATVEDEDDAEDLPVMSDDVYGQGLLWQSQSKDNLKYVGGLDLLRVLRGF